MSNYTTVKIMDNFYSIELNSMVRSFLFIGEEDAILVDTCTGEGDSGDQKDLPTFPSVLYSPMRTETTSARRKLRSVLYAPVRIRLLRKQDRRPC